MEGSRGYPDYQYAYQPVQRSDTSTGAVTVSSGMSFPRTSSGTSSELETSFDSGYFSPSQPHSFTALTSQPRGAHHVYRSPFKTSTSVVSDLMGRSHWSEDLVAGVTDEWDKNLLESLEENLFGLDASDLNSLADGIFQSPFKSPKHSPYKSPRQGYSAVTNLTLSPFKSVSTANLMLPVPKRSPVRFGGSPFKSPFSSPGLSSPRRSGFNSSACRSPQTRQRRLILHSPDHKENVESSLSTNFLDIPSDLLEDIKEVSGSVGAVPFQRQNSFGFLPQNDSPLSPPPFSDTYNRVQSYYEERSQSATLQSVIKQEAHQHVDASGLIEDENGLHNGSSCGKASSSHMKVSFTNLSQISMMPSRDVLYVMRARFRDALDKAVQDIKVKEQSENKPGAKRSTWYSEVAEDSPVPWTGDIGSVQLYADPHVFAETYSHRPSGKKHPEIRPKPETGLPTREPCRIAPKNVKKRKR